MRIGVLDTGVDATHSEFDGKTVHFMEFDEQGLPVPGAARDAGSHGTHVSGIAAGRTAGVAPASHLAVAAVLTIPTRRGLSGSLGQILAGLNWLVETDFGDDAPLVLANASLGLSEYNDFLYPSLETARTVAGVSTGTVVQATTISSSASAPPIRMTRSRILVIGEPWPSMEDFPSRIFARLEWRS